MYRSILLTPSAKYNSDIFLYAGRFRNNIIKYRAIVVAEESYIK